MLQRCKILGRTISFTLKYKEIRCVTILYTLYGSGLLRHKGGGGYVQQPRIPGPKPIK